jgi:hypothetical protein
MQPVPRADRQVGGGPSGVGQVNLPSNKKSRDQATGRGFNFAIVG